MILVNGVLIVYIFVSEDSKPFLKDLCLLRGNNCKEHKCDFKSL